MRNIMFVLLFIATGTTNMNAIGADWKFCGGATLFEGEQTIAFYDSESVDQTSSGTIKVWVKCLNESKFEEVMKNNKKQIFDKSAVKVVNKYYPPYSLANSKTSFEDYLDIILWEECANSYEIDPRSKYLFEIHCADKKIRTLYRIVYNENAEIKSSSKVGDWEYISPESNSDILRKILCKQ